MTAICKIQRTRYISTKWKNVKHLFIHRNPDSLQKARQFPLRLYIQKASHFTLRNFSWKFWSWHLYTKSMTLCVTWHVYMQKSRTLRKKKDKLRYVFIYKNPNTLRYAIFVEFFKLAERKGHFYMQKKKLCALHFCFFLNVLPFLYLNFIV